MFPCQTESQAITAVFSGSQEGWGVASNFRSSRIEPLPQILQVQNVDNQMIVSQIQSGDWFVTIDLKDAYFHVEILPQHRKFLRFAFGGEAYQYRVLPFGLALSPRTYTKCMDAALTPGHPHFKLQRRLADSGTVSRACASTSRCRPSSSRISGVETQRKKSVLSPAQRTRIWGLYGIRSRCRHSCLLHASNPF